MGWCLLGLDFLLPQWGSLTEAHTEHCGYVHPSLPTPHYQALGIHQAQSEVPLLPTTGSKYRVKMDWERRRGTCQKALNASDTGDGLRLRQ